MLDIIGYVIIGIFVGICVGVTLSNNYVFSKLNLRKTSAQICLGSLLSTIIFSWLEINTPWRLLDYDKLEKSPFHTPYLNSWFGYVSGFFFILFCICIWYIFFKKKNKINLNLN